MATPLVDRHVTEGRGAWPALRLRDRLISYSELQILVNRAGNTLKDVGVRPEQRVALLLPDSPEFIAAFIGAMKIGAVPVPINTAARPGELAYMLGDCRARAVVVDESLVRDLPAGDWTTLHAGDLTAGLPELEAFPTGVDEPCYWLYSSGTTGSPKGVVHLHGDMLACVTPYAEEVVAVEPEDVTFSVARLFFSYGLVNSLFLPLLAGASSALIAERPDVTRTLEAVKHFHPTLFFSVPTSYAQLCAAGEGGAFASVRLAVSAGEPLPEPLYTRWKSLTNIEVVDGLGNTEVGYIFCSNLPGAVKP